MTALASPRLERSALSRHLHRTDPYDGFDPTPFPDDVRGWHGDAPFFGELIRALRPRLVVEVGSWKGQSAITMARALDQLGPGHELCCVDTWLGAVEFVLNQHDEERYGSLAHRHGYPTVYYQFLANVVRAGMQHVVVPFPQTSLTAARWLLRMGLQPELVYVDGSHEERDVYADLEYYWLAAAPGAVLFGDDLDWPGVRNAVQAFAADQRTELRYRDDMFWVLRKPG